MARLIAAFGLIMLVGVALADLQSNCIGDRGLPMDSFTRKCCDEMYLRCEGGNVANACSSCKTGGDYHIQRFERCCGGLGTKGKTFDFNPWGSYAQNPIGNAPPPGTLPDVTKYNPYPNINPYRPSIPNYPQPQFG